jgi:uncharacterized membrane protein HdeD (DUF308 family)
LEAVMRNDMIQVEHTLHDLWPLFMAEGLSLLVLGAIAILLPPFMGLAIAILLGWLLLVSGLIGLVATLANPRVPGFWLSVLSNLLAGAIGFVLFSWPAGGVLSLTLALALFLFLDGLLAIFLAFEHHRHMKPKWAWLAANGVLDIVFAGSILIWLPQNAGWALGLIVGADLLIGGATVCAMALDERHMEAA